MALLTFLIHAIKNECDRLGEDADNADNQTSEMIKLNIQHSLLRILVDLKEELEGKNL